MAEPSSPKTSPIKLDVCIEQLLKLILSSSIEETLEFDLGLSKDYCSDLLKDDPNYRDFDDSDTLQGVPPYPLYKRLASALHHCIISGAFLRTSNAMMSINEDEFVEQKKDGWNDLVLQKGSGLVKVLKSVKYELHVQEPFFSQLRVPRLFSSSRFNSITVGIEVGPSTLYPPYFAMKLLLQILLVLSKDKALSRSQDSILRLLTSILFCVEGGLKTVEGRCAAGDYNQITSGSLLLFNKCLLLQVLDVKRHASFSEMLETESLQKVLPGVKTVEEGVEIYRKFYTEEKEKCNGVLAFHVFKPASQPYVSLAGILSGLGYEGVGSLLGLMHTAGTVPKTLHPPRSALLSSFMMPHKPNSVLILFEVKGSTLTQGARALAKHVSRSSSGWWGSFSGNDLMKNSLALAVISHILTYCCWANIHIVPPNGGVLEVRVAEGYGARWSKDGIKDPLALFGDLTFNCKICNVKDAEKWCVPTHLHYSVPEIVNCVFQISSDPLDANKKLLQLKFIGFLEPYMDDGHLRGWKH
ncbi:hypothetical protein GIB67_035527 [Kingdonia uniflora]|uniref:ASCH domain-containing protein n=1 Tax=Kingdonia uniflora TaxID=39325 RepID=A0A7J7MC64_9MAGN|nr:hypothetical protein GIB67_035527 [Kingdonia uniflora]